MSSDAPLIAAAGGASRVAALSRLCWPGGRFATAVVLAVAAAAAADPPTGTRDAHALPAEAVRQAMQTPSAVLVEVADLMAQAGRDLDTGQTGAQTRRRQHRAVDMLDALIRAAEEQQGGRPQPGACQQCQGRGCPACSAGRVQASGRPQGPAQSSGVVRGSAQAGPLRQAAEARPGEMWGRMRPEERDRILQSLNQAFPGRYRTLVEQYYRRLATE